MAKFSNSSASGANSKPAGGNTATNGGQVHVDAGNLMDRCIAGNTSTRPEPVNLPKETK